MLRPGPAALFGLLSLGCATTTTVPQVAEAAPTPGAAAPGSEGPGGPRPAPSEARALPASGRDLADVALEASGLDGEARQAAREELDTRLLPLTTELLRLPDPDARARALLTRLHQDWLRRYDARATSLVELLEDGRFNCLSSAVLYNIVAERLGLVVTGELLPTHARSIVALRSGARAVVEATSPHGFDPDVRTQAQILAQVATPAEPGQRAIVADTGARVPSVVLAGTIYVNRASLAQESGELARAEQLFARAEALAGASETRVVLRDQRAALLTQLAANDLLSREPARTTRAYATMLAVMRLGTSDAAVRATAEHNTRAAAERVVAAFADRGSEDGVAGVLADIAKIPLSKPTRAALEAFGWSELGRLRAQKGDLEGTLAAIDRGLEAELGAGDAHLALVLRENRYATLRRFALSTAKAGQLERSLELVRRLEALPGLSATQKQEATRDRSRVLQVGAEARMGAGDLAGAVALYRQAYALEPDDETARHNLVAGLQRLTIDAVNAGRCAEVRDALQEIRRAAPRDPYADKAEARCLLLEASARLDADDPAGAVDRLRAAARLRPDDATVRTNLGLGLLAWARAHVLARRCADARPLLDEARKLGAQTAPIEGAYAKACRGF